MPRRNWKRIQPTSLSHAAELCKDHAREKLNRSVDNIADLIGLANKWAIYKWIESGSIPGHMILAYEHACGIDYYSRYLVHSAHRLVIDIPKGRAISGPEIHQLQEAFNHATGLLMKFARGDADANQTIGSITKVMEALAWHRHNVEKHPCPELDFEEQDT